MSCISKQLRAYISARPIPTGELWCAVGNDEEEMHWTPLTGLPEPLSAAACKGAGVRPDRNAHVLEKQVCCYALQKTCRAHMGCAAWLCCIFLCVPDRKSARFSTLGKCLLQSEVHA